MKKILSFLIPLFFLLPASAQERNQAVKQVEKFFDNYGLISNWPAFQEEQSKILSPQLQTYYSDHRGAKLYQGPAGYFASLGDWSQAFATGADFHLKIVQVNADRIVVRLHGTLTLASPINGFTQLQDSQHAWTETFYLNEQGLIERLEVRMNLFPK